MANKTEVIHAGCDQDLVNEIDSFRDQRAAGGERPSRSAAARILIRAGLRALERERAQAERARLLADAPACLDLAHLVHVPDADAPGALSHLEPSK